MDGKEDQNKKRHLKEKEKQFKQEQSAQEREIANPNVFYRRSGDPGFIGVVPFSKRARDEQFHKFITEKRVRDAFQQRQKMIEARDDFKQALEAV